ncbi:MAG: cytochrome c [Pirellulaceae bacterium]
MDRAVEAEPDRSPADTNEPLEDLGVGFAIVDQSCAQCHPVNNQSRVGVIGVDLQGVGGRLNADWFRKTSARSGTLHAGDAHAGVLSSRDEQSSQHRRGDVARQIAGLWSYLRPAN